MCPASVFALVLALALALALVLAPAVDVAVDLALALALALVLFSFAPAPAPLAPAHNKRSKPAGNSGTTVFVNRAFSHHDGKATKGFACPRAAQWSQHFPFMAAWIFFCRAAAERWERGCHEMN